MGSSFNSTQFFFGITCLVLILRTNLGTSAFFLAFLTLIFLSAISISTPKALVGATPLSFLVFSPVRFKGSDDKTFPLLFVKYDV